MSRIDHLVTVADLERELTGDSAPILLDVRWHLADEPGAGRGRYAANHLPGARFLDLEAVLSAHTGDPRDGRHPLPDLATLSAGLGALGLEADSEVVVYDEAGSFAADRAWWVLRWVGIRARELDGGIAAWTAASGELETGDPAPWATTTPVLLAGAMPTLTANDAAAWSDHGTLVDVRAGARYRGETEPLDPRAGHIPGAVNALQAASLFTPDGHLPADEDLRRAAGDLASTGLDAGGDLVPGPEVAAYCGSGVSAAHSILALAVLDVPGALFPGSWSAWANDPERPVATGA